MINRIIKSLNLHKIVPTPSLFFFLSYFLQRAISILFMPIFTFLLSPTEYGELSVFGAWQSVVIVFVTLNINHGVFISGLVKFEDDYKKFSASMQGLVTILCLFWTIIYFTFAEFWRSFFSLSHVQILVMLLLIWTNTVYSFWTGEQRVRKQYKKFSVVTILYAIVEPVLAVIFILNSNDKVLARILATVLINIIFFTPIFLMKALTTKVFFIKKYWIYALKFNIVLLAHYLAGVALSNADRIMIGNMVGEASVGIYSLAYSLSMIMLVFNQAIMQFVEPWIYERIKKKELLEISKVTYPLIEIVAALNIILILLAPDIIKIFAPIEYYDAIWIIPPVAMSVYFMFIYMFFVAFEFYYEKKLYITISTGIAAIFNIALNYVFIKIYGYYAAGYTTLICYILYTIFHYAFMRGICKKNFDIAVYDSKKIIKTSIIFLLLGFASLTSYNYIYLRYLAITIILMIAIIKRKKILSLLSAFNHFR